MTRACSAVPRLRTLCTKPPPTTTAGGRRPTEAEVRALAESARNQQKMWDTFVPEGGVKLGDKCAPALRLYPSRSSSVSSIAAVIAFCTQPC